MTQILRKQLDCCVWPWAETYDVYFLETLLFEIRETPDGMIDDDRDALPHLVVSWYRIMRRRGAIVILY